MSSVTSESSFSSTFSFSAQTRDSCTTLEQALGCLRITSKVHQVAEKVFRRRLIRTEIFSHVSALDVASLINAFRLIQVVDGKESATYLNPLRNVFTDAELADIKEMVRRGDVMVLYGYDLKGMFEGTQREEVHRNSANRRGKARLWLCGGSMLPAAFRQLTRDYDPLTPPGCWTGTEDSLTMWRSSDVKINTPSPNLRVVNHSFTCIDEDADGNTELVTRIDMAELLGESTTGIMRPRRAWPSTMYYVNLGQDKMKLECCDFRKGNEAELESCMSLRVDVWDSAFGRAVYGAYRLDLSPSQDLDDSLVEI